MRLAVDHSKQGRGIMTKSVTCNDENGLNLRTIKIDIDGKTKIFSTPFRDLELHVEEIASFMAAGRGYVRPGQVPKDDVGPSIRRIEAKFVLGKMATIGVAGEGDKGSRNLSGTISVADKDWIDWSNAGIQNGTRPFPIDVAFCALKKEFYEGGGVEYIVDLRVSRELFDQIWLAIDSKKFEGLSAQIKVWNVFCESDIEMEPYNFPFLLRPDGDRGFGYIAFMHWKSSGVNVGLCGAAGNK